MERLVEGYMTTLGCEGTKVTRIKICMAQEQARKKIDQEAVQQASN